MNRRELLQRFGLVPAVTLLPAVACGYPETTQQTYKGFRLWWSGWQQQVNQFIYFGFWVAKRPGDFRTIYSSYPGATESCWNGQIMNTARQDWQKLLDPFCDVAELDDARQQALDRLIAYIDKNVGN